MQGPMPDRVYNYMPEGTGLCTIGEIPIDFSEETGAVSSVSINALITSWSIEGLELNFEKEGHFALNVHMPVKVENDFGGTITVQMILDDRMDNWWTLYRYARTLLNPHDGVPKRDPNSGEPWRAGAYAQRRMAIPYIEMRVGDGNLEMLNVFKFKRCYLKSLGKLPMRFGQEGNITFGTSWTYDNIDMIRIPQDDEYPISIGD